MKRWLENKHLALWRGPCSTQRQARELISGPDLAMGLDYCPLTGHKPWLLLASLLDITPSGDIYTSWGYVMTPCAGNVVLRRKPVHILCEGEALASLRHAYLGSLFLDPEDIRGTRHGGHLELC